MRRAWMLPLLRQHVRPVAAVGAGRATACFAPVLLRRSHASSAASVLPSSQASKSGDDGADGDGAPEREEPSSAFDKIKRSTPREGVVYLDNLATTPTDRRVLDRMLPYFCVAYGNPHSRTHAFGWESESAVEDARAHIAKLIAAQDPREIVFTSGATEANNLALKGVARFYRNAGRSPRSHIVTTVTEHKCVLDACRALETEGFSITYLPVEPRTGLVRPEDVAAAIRPDTALVSVMAVNNEIGVVQPLAEIGAVCRAHRVFFHTDAAQAVGKIPIDVERMSIDLMSISAHKLYGPKGIGALYVRRRPRVRLEPLFSGGGQERGIRSGTVPAPLAVGFGEACRIASDEMETEYKRISALSKRLINGVMSKLTHVELNGHPEKRHPGCVNLSFACVEGESLLMALKDFALSSGSACTSASLEPSYVLRALRAVPTKEDSAAPHQGQSVEIGKISATSEVDDDSMAHSSIRFGIGRFTTQDEIDRVVVRVVESVNKLREMSPLWEMVQEGIDLNTIKWTH